MKIKSPAFADGTIIPSQYTCDGADINPELTIDEVPMGAKSLAILVDDPDSPSGNFAHWLVWNIAPTTTTIAENATDGDWPAGAVQGTNDFPKVGYGGPCPSSGEHHYHFKIFALNAMLDLPESTDKEALSKALNSHIIGQSELVGLYQRSDH